jgi:hypothetical protein
MVAIRRLVVFCLAPFVIPIGVACVGDDPGSDNPTTPNDGGAPPSTADVIKVDPPVNETGVPPTGDAGFCGSQPAGVVFCEDFDLGKPKDPEWIYEINDGGAVTFENGQLRTSDGVDVNSELQARMVRVVTTPANASRYIFDFDIRVERADAPRLNVSIFGFGLDGANDPIAFLYNAAGKGVLVAGPSGAEFELPLSGTVRMRCLIEKTATGSKASLIIDGNVVSTVDGLRTPGAVHRVGIGVFALGASSGPTVVAIDRYVFRTE